MKFEIPLRLVRIATLRRIRTEAQAADEAAELYSDEATKWRENYLEEVKRAETAEHSAERAEETIENQGEQLAHLRRLLDETAAEL
ncbi:hypothetical protein, partial [Streptomyces sp. GSL17-113]|uniref:hypothetical protein n=1 Tax=Streptomyces sp. GSL17-113 TaxID=3115365 RepID=UPI002E7A05AE